MLNTTGAIRTLEKLSPGDRASLFLATGCGVGFIPKAPGTFGSLAALLPVAGLLQLPPWLYVLAAVATTLLGVPICGRGARALHATDPGSVVLDEVAGMLWTFSPLALFAGGSLNWQWACAGFLLFRLFDITKPPPVRTVEKFPGGWGIMADDVVAGCIAGAVLWGLHCCDIV